MKSFDLAAVLQLPQLPAYLQRVDEAMHAMLLTNAQPIGAPLQRFLKRPGKKLRASLVLAAALTAEREPSDAVIAGATAIELVHLASLIHDDAIDNASHRHNAQTISSKEGFDWAVLVGDYVLAQANAQAARIDAQAAGLIADTIAVLCEGQALEMSLQYNLERTPDEYEAAVARKTGHLMETACRLGAITGGVAAREHAALQQFGAQFGLAFQVVDDILDFIGDEHALGKTPGTDVHEGIYTLPLLLAFEADAGLRNQFDPQEPMPHDELTKRLLELNSIQDSVARAHHYNRKAMSVLPPHAAYDNLRRLPQNYTEWALNQLADRRYVAAVD